LTLQYRYTTRDLRRVIFAAAARRVSPLGGAAAPISFRRRRRRRQLFGGAPAALCLILFAKLWAISLRKICIFSCLTFRSMLMLVLLYSVNHICRNNCYDNLWFVMLILL